MKRVGLYIRVSTEEQIENHSIPEQKERLENFCKAKDWLVVDEYIDGGYSGAKLDRPAVQKMIADTGNGAIDTVLVWKLDRLSRSQKDMLYLIEDVFIPNNVDFVSLNESLDTGTAFGRAMIGILSAFAQLEREQIKERTMMGRIARAKSGLVMGPTAPYGYRYIDGQLIIDEYEASIVREIYDLYLQGYGMEKVSNMLYEKMQLTSASGYAAVRRILSRPTYAGLVHYSGEVYPGQHEKIIDVDMWKRVQEKREHSRNYQRGKRQKHLLTGMIYCKRCGAKYAYHVHSGNNYYDRYMCYSVCRSRKELIKDPHCDNTKYLASELEELIVAQIKELAFDESKFNKVIQKRIAVPDPTQAMQKQIREIDKQINNFMDLYQYGKVPVETINERIEKLTQEKSAIEKSIRELNVKPIPKREDYESTLSRVDSIFETGNADEQRAAVKNLIDHIDIDGENVVIHWVFE